jgi:hypothetical protein
MFSMFDLAFESETLLFLLFGGTAEFYEWNRTLADIRSL